MELTLKNHKIKIIQDNDPTSPREDDNLGIMVCFHGRYNLGDNHDYNKNNYDSWNELEKAIEKNEKPLAILPLYLYDHSGITISTAPFGCRWDSGQVGFIFTTREKVSELMGANVTRNSKKLREKLEKQLIGEVETYDQYLTGDIYGYEIYDEEENLVDSCWGYYGQEECLKEAESIVEHIER
jgi:hypothetical protein